MERVWMCIPLCYSQIQYRHMVEEKEARDLWGLDCAKNRRTLVHMRERSVSMGRVWVYVPLCFSQIQSYGRSKAGTRPVGVGLSQKPEDLSASGRCVSMENEFRWLISKPRSRVCVYIYYALHEMKKTLLRDYLVLTFKAFLKGAVKIGHENYYRIAALHRGWSPKCCKNGWRPAPASEQRQQE